ncbi:MAG: hypothetical protein RLZZ436_1750 [Planctomycetota bacterium]|jgi:uncharacterized protein (TIGR00266 family)
MNRLEHQIAMNPDFAVVSVRLQHGQRVFSEPSAMASMTPNLTLKAGLKSGLRKSLGRVFAGESLVTSSFSADNGPGEVTLAPGVPGDIRHHYLDRSTLYLQRGSFLAHSEGVDISGKWQGAKGFFSGEGLVLVKAQGTGDVFFNSYGAILEFDVRNSLLIDTGYIVAFEDTLQYNVQVLPGARPAKTIKNFLFGGEGFVCRFSGQGKVWVQTRYIYPLLQWVHPFRRVQRQN